MPHGVAASVAPLEMYGLDRQGQHEVCLQEKKKSGGGWGAQTSQQNKYFLMLSIAEIV